MKNYRPKLLVLSGNPAHRLKHKKTGSQSKFFPNRPSLMDFANVITKKISILIAGHVITDEGPVG